MLQTNAIAHGPPTHVRSAYMPTEKIFSSLCTAMDENVKVISVASIYCEKEPEQRLKSIYGGCGAAEMWSGEGRRTSKAAEGDEPTCDGYCWG